MNKGKSKAMPEAVASRTRQQLYDPTRVDLFAEDGPGRRGLGVPALKLQSKEATSTGAVRLLLEPEKEVDATTVVEPPSGKGRGKAKTKAKELAAPVEPPPSKKAKKEAAATKIDLSPPYELLRVGVPSVTERIKKRMDEKGWGFVDKKDDGWRQLVVQGLEQYTLLTPQAGVMPALAADVERVRERATMLLLQPGDDLSELRAAAAALSEDETADWGRKRVPAQQRARGRCRCERASRLAPPRPPDELPLPPRVTSGSTPSPSATSGSSCSCSTRSPRRSSATRSARCRARLGARVPGAARRRPRWRTASRTPFTSTCGRVPAAAAGSTPRASRTARSRRGRHRSGCSRRTRRRRASTSRRRCARQRG